MPAANSIDELLERMVERDASDLHVTTGTPPVIRVRGEVERVDEFDSLSAEETQQLLYRILSSEQQKLLELNRQLDFSHSIPGLARFRVNVYFQRESIGAAFRLIPTELKTLEELGIPSSLHTLAEKPRGLVLVTGPTGSGKSTTLAALIDEINRTRAEHILTIEDPIEFVHRHKRSLVNQREIGPDATTFAEALRAALRQDPDVILLGEMRDLETIAPALTAAETGQLVFGTLHTQSAPGTIDRMVDVFPAEQQEQVRVQIATSLQGVVTQSLLPTADGVGRVPALEILIPDDAIRNLIRQGKVEQIYSVMQTASSRGMQTMEQSLAELTLRGVITKQVGLSASSRRGRCARRARRPSGRTPGAGARDPPAGPRLGAASGAEGKEGVAPEEGDLVAAEAEGAEAGERAEDEEAAARGRAVLEEGDLAQAQAEGAEGAQGAEGDARAEAEGPGRRAQDAEAPRRPEDRRIGPRRRPRRQQPPGGAAPARPRAARPGRRRRRRAARSGGPRRGAEGLLQEAQA